MKKIVLSAAVLALVGLTSCEKCRDCVCVSESSFDFDAGIPESTKNTIESNVEAGFNSTYPERTDEICEKRGDFDAAVADYEAQSADFTENGVSGGLPWSFSGNYSCTCDE